MLLLDGISSTDESLCKNDMLVESSDNTDVICVLRMLQMKPYRYKLIRDKRCSELRKEKENFLNMNIYYKL